MSCRHDTERNSDQDPPLRTRANRWSKHPVMRPWASSLSLFCLSHLVWKMRFITKAAYLQGCCENQVGECIWNFFLYNYEEINTQDFGCAKCLKIEICLCLTSTWEHAHSWAGLPCWMGAEKQQDWSSSSEEVRFQVLHDWGPSWCRRGWERRVQALKSTDNVFGKVKERGEESSGHRGPQKTWLPRKPARIPSVFPPA